MSNKLKTSISARIYTATITITTTTITTTITAATTTTNIKTVVYEYKTFSKLECIFSSVKETFHDGVPLIKNLLGYTFMKTYLFSLFNHLLRTHQRPQYRR